MIIKGIRAEDFCQYKQASLFIAFPKCSFKCEKEAGAKFCQNSELALAPSIDIAPEKLVRLYMNDPLTHAIVFGGLEPLDTLWDVEKLIYEFRHVTEDPIIIFTGYTEQELEEKQHPLYPGTDVLAVLRNFSNVIVKFGRYKEGAYQPNTKVDPVLGITLVSKNQYAKKIS